MKNPQIKSNHLIHCSCKKDDLIPWFKQLTEIEHFVAQSLEQLGRQQKQRRNLSARVDGRTVQRRTFHSIMAGDATHPLQLGQKEESIPEGSKGKRSASCRSGVGWDCRGVKRKGSLGIENERDVI